MITGINHITLAVLDIEKSFSFYSGILGLKPVIKGKTGAYLTAGETWVALNQDDKAAVVGKPDYSHIAFTCGSGDFLKLKARLIDYGCKEWSENRSEGDSFYFLDPDGHKLEIHVGGLKSQLNAVKAEPWDEMVFY